jgi:hypothetical protein
MRTASAVTNAANACQPVAHKRAIPRSTLRRESTIETWPSRGGTLLFPSQSARLGTKPSSITCSSVQDGVAGIAGMAVSGSFVAARALIWPAP